VLTNSRDVLDGEEQERVSFGANALSVVCETGTTAQKFKVIRSSTLDLPQNKRPGAETLQGSHVHAFSGINPRKVIV